MGSFFNSPNISNRTLYDIVEAFCEMTGDYHISDAGREVILRNDTRLASGDYCIVTSGTVLSSSVSCHI